MDYTTTIETDYRFLEDAALAYNISGHRSSFTSFSLFVASLSPAKRKLVLSAVELFKRHQIDKKDIVSIHRSSDAFHVLSPYLSDLSHEEVWVIYINKAGRILQLSRLSSGGLDSSVVDERLILRNALLLNSTGFIIAHNHPSGSVTPSQSDDIITKKLKAAATTLSIRLCDHIIIAGSSFYSYNDEDII